MALGGLIPILELLDMDAGVQSVSTADNLRPGWRLFPPVPGAPWLWAMPRPRPNAALEFSPTVTAPAAFLFDEHANTPERMRRLCQQLAQTMNALIRNGRLSIGAILDDSIDLVLDGDLIADGLGYVPADEETEIPTGQGVTGGGTLGQPEIIRADETVLRLANVGGGQQVVFIPDAVPPTANPPAGVYLYIESGALSLRDAAGAINVP
jgi:hypothetical protein